MAKKTVVTLTDDIDGSEGAETVEFGIDGFLYSIDLSVDHAEELRDRLTAYREFGTALAKRLGESSWQAASAGQPRSEPRHPPLGRGQQPAGQSSRGAAEHGDREIRSRSRHCCVIPKWRNQTAEYLLRSDALHRI
jgi:hypothetical protein